MKNHDVSKCFKLQQKPIEERLKFFKENKLCFRCAKPGHGSKDCSANCDKCGMRHHAMLHDETRIQKAQAKQEAKDLSEPEVVVHSTSTVVKSRIGLSILPVIIQGNGTQVKTYALVDSASNTSLCKRELLDQLNIKGESTKFTVQTLTGHATVQDQQLASIKLRDIAETEEIDLNVLTVDKIPVSLKCLADSSTIKT